MTKPGHDGVRRWTIRYRSASGEPCDFLSDAVDMAGARAHFAEHNPDVRSFTVRRLHPDRWLNNRDL